MRTCDIAGCDAKHYGNGLCNKHNLRRRRHGDPLYKRPSPRTRFLDAVEKHPPEAPACWLWRQAKRPNGYGQFWMDGRFVSTHRAAYTLFVGPIPDGLYILHSCRNKDCVNPAHLRAGTATENMADRERDGTQLLGERHPNAKLSDADVRSILEALRNGEPQRSIGRRFGITQSAVSLINRGINWSHIA